MSASTGSAGSVMRRVQDIMRLEDCSRAIVNAHAPLRPKPSRVARPRKLRQKRSNPRLVSVSFPLSSLQRLPICHCDHHRAASVANSAIGPFCCFVTIAQSTAPHHFAKRRSARQPSATDQFSPAFLHLAALRMPAVSKMPPGVPSHDVRREIASRSRLAVTGRLSPRCLFDQGRLPAWRPMTRICRVLSLACDPWHIAALHDNRYRRRIGCILVRRAAPKLSDNGTQQYGKAIHPLAVFSATGPGAKRSSALSAPEHTGFAPRPSVLVPPANDHIGRPGAQDFRRKELVSGKNAPRASIRNRQNSPIIPPRFVQACASAPEGVRRGLFKPGRVDHSNSGISPSLPPLRARSRSRRA